VIYIHKALRVCQIKNESVKRNVTFVNIYVICKAEGTNCKYSAKLKMMSKMQSVSICLVRS